MARTAALNDCGNCPLGFQVGVGHQVMGFFAPDARPLAKVPAKNLSGSMGGFGRH
jgi:hypothetical protein